MQVLQSHPTTDELAAFGLGKLDPAEAEPISAHVAECEPCSETLAGLGNDTFIDLVERADGIELPRHERDDPLASHDGRGTDDPQRPAGLVDHPRYRTVELLGRGGMGDVYKAEHRMMNRTVALKAINSKLVAKPAAVDRFHREVQAAAQLAHPNIVTSHDAEQVGDLHFLVMEYVDGTDLSKLVKERGPLPIQTACDWISQAARGLQHAHEQGMVHRDIKPHNLMVTSDSVVKILDFGLATFASAVGLEPSVPADENDDDASEHTTTRQLTRTGMTMGTPDFISPEQADDGQRADARSDIYSLGCTLYYLLTGRPPFEEGSITDKLTAHRDRDPQPLALVRDDVPKELCGIVERMMAKDPDARFQSATEVAVALRPWLDRDQTSKPRRSKTVQPPWRFRRTALAIAGGLLLVAAAVVITIRIGKDGTVAVQVDAKTVSATHNDQPAAERQAAADNLPPVDDDKPADVIETNKGGVRQGQDEDDASQLQTAPVSDADQTAWLTSGLPPLIDPNKAPPFEITKLTLTLNHVDQEIMKAEWRRSWMPTVLAMEVKLVILPSAGGRYAFYAHERMVNSPRPITSLTAVSGYLMDFRGEIPGGARAYLEMRTGISSREMNPPVRISKVFWMGTDTQLAAAQKKGPPPNMNSGKRVQPEIVPLPAGVKLPLVTPVWLHANGRTRYARIAGPAAKENQALLMVSFTYPGSLYKPWHIEAVRDNVSIEPGILEELKTLPDSRHLKEFAAAYRGRLPAGADVPYLLESAAGRDIEAGQRLLLLSNGSLSPILATGPAEEGVVVVTGPRGGASSRKRLADLYLDPTPEPTPPSADKTSDASASTFKLIPVADHEKLKPGDKLKTRWVGSKWYDVEVVDVLEDGRVKILWVGYGSNWDEARPRAKLFRSAPEESSTPTAESVETQNDKKTPERSEGKE